MHDRIKSSDVIDPSKLSINEKGTFAGSLYRLHSKIFDGVEKAGFVSYVIDSPADWTRIRIYKNNLNEWVGYCAVHRFNTKVIKGDCVIIRAEAGILREYRGRSKTLLFGLVEAAKYRIRHPFCALYYLGSFVHPSVFYMFSRCFSEYYPRPDLPLPDRVKDFLLELASLFHIEPIEGQDVLVRQVGWITRESAEDRDFWQNHKNPAVKFYLKINPGYVDGNGLISLVPLTFNNLFISLTRFLTRRLRRHLSR